MSTRVVTSDRNTGFDLNSLGDYVMARNVNADWARFQVEPIGDGTFGNAVVNLMGSLDLAGVESRSFFTINPAMALTDFGLSGYVNVTGIPSLRLVVQTVHGSASTPCIARISYAANPSP